MAQELLRNYLVERLLDLDPSLSDDPGSPMFQKVIDPLLVRLGTDPLGVDIEEFVISRLKDDPLTQNLDMESAGSFLKDAVARPLMILLEPLQREIEYLKTQQSRANTDALSKEEMDSLLSNIFATREFGEVATGSVRVYYSAPQPVSVDASIVFSTSAGLQFIPSVPQVKTEGDFIREGDLYYVSIDIQSVVPHVGTNVAEDTIKTVAGLPNVVRVTNPNKLAGGVTEETNEEFDRRSARSLSERSLNTIRGISTTLKEQFTDLTSLDVVGYREPEMNRDLLTGTVTLNLASAPGKVAYTSIVFQGYSMVDLGVGSPPDPDADLDNWNSNDEFPFTTVIQSTAFVDYATFLAAWNLVKDSVFYRVFTTGGNFNEPLLTRIRGIKSFKAVDAADAVLADETDPNARKIRVILDDFTIAANDGRGTITTPAGWDGTYSDQGADYKLLGSSNDWRGAPLPFTDVVDITGSELNSYTVDPGKDFLVVRGSTSDLDARYYLGVWQVRKKISNNKLQVHRLDAEQVSRRKVTLPHTLDGNVAVSNASEGIEVISYGAPAIGDPAVDAATMFDGINTVTGGAQYRGGCALYERNSDPGFAFLKIASHASRPNGWESLGVVAGHFVSVSAFGSTTSTPTNANNFDWWQWARVAEVGPAEASGDKHVIKVYGLEPEKIKPATALLSYQNSLDPFTGDPNYFGFPDASPYRLHWTVYRGELEVVLSNGNVHTTYEDFVWPPAFDTSATGGNQWDEAEDFFPGPTRRKLTSGASAEDTGNMYRWAGIVNSEPGGVINHNMSWAIFRLKDKFSATQVDGGTLVIQEDPSAVHIKPHASLVALSKYPDLTDVDSYANSIVVPSMSPFMSKAHLWERVGVNATPATASSVAFTEPATLNERALTGMIVPTYMGGSSKEVSQFFEAATASLTDPQISVSNIPGSYPFTEEFGDPVTVSSGSVHLGGLTDIYVKGAASEEAATSFALRPDVIAVASTNDVVFEATDGSIDSTKGGDEMSSATFFGTYSSTEAAALVGHAVEITSSSYSAIVDKVYRIVEIDYSNSLIRLSTSIYPGPGTLSNIEFRVLSQVTTDLKVPKRVYQEGTDGRLTLESNAIYSDAGFTFPASLVGTAYIEIQEGENKGEYAVLTYGANKLIIDGVVIGPETDLNFRVYTKDNGVDVPLVRLRKVELASDDGAGIEVPYRHPVQVLAESFSGLNNDPETYTGKLNVRKAGNYTTPAHAVINSTGTGKAHIYHTDSSYSFVDAGIILYDVVKLDGMAEDDTYWYVTAISDTGTDKSITLDRDITTNQVSLDGTIGKPSLGEVKMFFMAPTYLDVGPLTVLKTTDGALSFRPSPAEESTIYESASTSTDLLITPNAPSTDAIIRTKSFDFHLNDVQIGDKVQVTHGCLESGYIPEATANNLNSLVGKTLILDVGGVQESIVFSSVSGNLTLDDVVSQINTKLGSKLRAKKESFNPRIASISADATTPIVTTTLDHQLTTGDNVTISGSYTLPDSVNVSTVATVTGAKTFTINAYNTSTSGDTGVMYLETPDSVLKLYSKSTITVKDSSTGVLSTLNLTLSDTNTYGDFTAVITAVNYDPDRGVWSLTISETGGTGNIPDVAVAPAFDPEVFVKITRDQHQIFYPGNMVLEDNGLYSASFTASSRGPLTTERITENTLLNSTGHDTMGYELIVDNDNYSFSAAEELDVRCTPTIMAPEATDFSEQFVVPSATVDVNYDRSQLVEDIQSYALSDFGRVINNNPLSRHYFPAYLYMTLKVSGGKSAEELKKDVSEYVGQLYPNKELETYDIDKVLDRGGVTSVQHPIEVLFLTHNSKREIVPVRSNTSVTLGKTFHIMEDDTNITVEKT